MIKLASLSLTGIFALGLLAAPAAFAEDSGTTAKGGSAAANAGSNGDKADKQTQENAESSDKSKQK